MLRGTESEDILLKYETLSYAAWKEKRRHSVEIRNSSLCCVEWKAKAICGNIKLGPVLCGMESEDTLCKYETLPYAVWNGKRRRSVGI